MSMQQRSGYHGQGLVEFALVLPIFLLILFGLIDAGRYVYMNSVLSQAAREGARLAAAEARWIGKTTTDDPSCVANAGLITSANPGAHVCPATPTGASNSLEADIRAAANRMIAPFGSVQNLHFLCQPTGTAAPANWASAPSDCTVANRTASKSVVWVRVELTFQPITPVIGSTWTFTTSGSATMAIN
jgi:Flp pilus assembly protein TadG